EAQPVRSVRRAENPVLLEQVVNDRLLLPINPAREQQEQKGEWRRQRVHRARVPEGTPPIKRANLVTADVRDSAEFSDAQSARLGDDTPIFVGSERRPSFRTARAR